MRLFDQDRSAASRQLLAGLDGSGVFQRVADLHRAADIAALIDASRRCWSSRSSRDFERRLRPGQAADVQVIADGRNSNTAGTAMGYVGAVVAAFNADWRADHGLTGPPVQIVARAWYNPNLETRWNMIPGMIGTLTLMQTMLLTAMSVAREREQGTFDQLLVTPFRPCEIMAGKALPSMLVGTVQATASCWWPSSGSASRSQARSDALRGPAALPAGGGRHRPAALGGRRRPCSRRCSTRCC